MFPQKIIISRIWEDTSFMNGTAASSRCFDLCKSTESKILSPATGQVSLIGSSFTLKNNRDSYEVVSRNDLGIQMRRLKDVRAIICRKKSSLSRVSIEIHRIGTEIFSRHIFTTKKRKKCRARTIINLYRITYAQRQYTNSPGPVIVSGDRPMNRVWRGIAATAATAAATRSRLYYTAVSMLPVHDVVRSASESFILSASWLHVDTLQQSKCLCLYRAGLYIKGKTQQPRRHDAKRISICAARKRDYCMRCTGRRHEIFVCCRCVPVVIADE
ncbi:unnamed protein product [Trichogramma brassicae]|uniref:Uncharacterized protein n=1 Tax=Trichogramma brassicae TaxID=86971 RepID=A0A6H5IGR1_9HYME|nr:unnamed protein product [Trichogramma brassicae]